MIREEAVAAQVSEMMLELGARLDESVRVVRETCSEEEFTAYRKSVGRIMGEILLGVLNPLYEEHPMLRPAGLSLEVNEGLKASEKKQ